LFSSEVYNTLLDLVLLDLVLLDLRNVFDQIVVLVLT
jgi:hypothetical protein